MSATTKGTAKVTTPAADQILITREFTAPAASVWRAYTTPELIKRWWAGQRGTVTSADVDLRVGGQWRYVMTAHGGFEVAFRGEFHEIEEPVRLVNTEIYEGIPAPDDHASVVTVTFTTQEDRTVLTMLAQYRSEADRDAVLESGMEGGMQESMDALDEVAAAF